MVWLGPRWRGAFRPRLHDAPPGYRPARPRIALGERQRMARRDWVLEHVLALILVLSAGAFMVIMILIIAAHL